jgi:hypothetical protein
MFRGRRVARAGNGDFFLNEPMTAAAQRRWPVRL